MCGIYSSIATKGFCSPDGELKQLLCNRGPDHTGTAQELIKTKAGQEYFVSFLSTVLSLRGGHVTAQPFADSLSGSKLCWNGEAWKIGTDPVIGNDGQAVFEKLIEASSMSDTIFDSKIALLKVLQCISGPFAFVFLDKKHDQIYFGRDRLGRRSLLYKIGGDASSLELSSTSDPSSGPWLEVEADAVYQLSLYEKQISLSHESITDKLSMALAPIHKHLWVNLEQEMLKLTLGRFNRAIPTEDVALDSDTASVGQLHHHLSESLKLRILNVPPPQIHEHGADVRVAILFSGGLDCTVLARMAHDILPSDQQIDLLNVAFENPRVVQAVKNASLPKQKSGKRRSEREHVPIVEEAVSNAQSPYESCPDRQTGRKAVEELRKVCPNRTWRFVAVDIPYTETLAHREKVVSLIHPHNTEMDLSIAYALYFAARGCGTAMSNTNSNSIPYRTPARVLLSGLGADELFGGYTRHATAFSRTGFPGLLDELKLDVDRLGKRNLGRDDRVISHWGREARFPYLDEEFVKWAVECPIWEKCGFRLKPLGHNEEPDIEPGKKVLRLLAYHLGMHSVAVEKKRAIQFGARTAKMEIGRIKGTALIS